MIDLRTNLSELDNLVVQGGDAHSIPLVSANIWDLSDAADYLAGTGNTNLATLTFLHIRTRTPGLPQSAENHLKLYLFDPPANGNSNGYGRRPAGIPRVVITGSDRETDAMMNIASSTMPRLDRGEYAPEMIGYCIDPADPFNDIVGLIRGFSIDDSALLHVHHRSANPADLASIHYPRGVMIGYNGVPDPRLPTGHPT